MALETIPGGGDGLAMSSDEVTVICEDSIIGGVSALLTTGADILVVGGMLAAGCVVFRAVGCMGVCNVLGIG